MEYWGISGLCQGVRRSIEKWAYPIEETLCPFRSQTGLLPPVPSLPRGRDQSVRPKTAVAVAARVWCNNMWGMMSMTYSIFESFEDNSA